MIWSKVSAAREYYTAKLRQMLRDPLATGIILVLTSWGGFFVYLWSQMFRWGEKGIEAGWLFIWADWAAHLTYTNVFVHRPLSEWLIGHPLYVGQKFSYPFGTNLISALLIRGGWDVVSAFVIPSMIFTLWFLVILLIFYKQISRSVSRAYVGVTLFLAGGGLGFYTFFQDVWNHGWSAILYPLRQATQFEEIGLRWYNVVTGQLLPQRAFLLGLPWLFSVAVWLERQRQKKFTGWQWWQVFLAGFLAALLSLIHMHSYIVLVIMCAVLALWHWQSWRFWVWFAVGAFFPSLAVYLVLYGGEVGTSFFRWYPGWLANPRAFDMNWLWFWTLNWGIFLPLAVWGTGIRQHWRQPWIVVGWTLFALANLILFQPYDWDNSKILTYAYLFLIPAVLAALHRLWHMRQRWLGAIVATTLFLFLTLAGWIDLWRVSAVEEHVHVLVSYQDMELADRFMAISQPTDLSLTSDVHNLWLPMLTGRPIMMGYRGWLWSYGIDYTAVQSDVATLFAGGPQAEKLIDHYGITFIVIDLGAERDWKPNEAYYSERYPRVLSGGYSRVYRVR